MIYIGGIVYQVKELEQVLKQPNPGGSNAWGLVFEIKKSNPRYYEQIDLEVGSAYMTTGGLKINYYQKTLFRYACDLQTRTQQNLDDCCFEFCSFLKKSLDEMNAFYAYLNNTQFELIKHYKCEEVMITGAYENYTNQKSTGGITMFPDSWFTLKMEPLIDNVVEPTTPLGLPYYQMMEACPKAWAQG